MFKTYRQAKHWLCFNIVFVKTVDKSEVDLETIYNLTMLPLTILIMNKQHPKLMTSGSLFQPNEFFIVIVNTNQKDNID